MLVHVEKFQLSHASSLNFCSSSFQSIGYEAKQKRVDQTLKLQINLHSCKTHFICPSYSFYSSTDISTYSNVCYRMLTSMVISFARKLDTLSNSGCALTFNKGKESLPFPNKITKSFAIGKSRFLMVSKHECIY